MRACKSDANGQSQIFTIPCYAVACDANNNVTYTSSVPHRLATGARVKLTGPVNSPYNCEVTVTVISPTIFTFVLPGAYFGTVPAIQLTAKQTLPATQYEPFALIRNNRLQVETATPDASLYINDTAAHTGQWVELLALSNCVFASLTSGTLAGFAAGMALPAGTRIKGVFTALQLTSGQLLATS